MVGNCWREYHKKEKSDNEIFHERKTSDASAHQGSIKTTTEAKASVVYSNSCCED
jgi:hypothetical protein